MKDNKYLYFLIVVLLIGSVIVIYSMVSKSKTGLENLSPNVMLSSSAKNATYIIEGLDLEFVDGVSYLEEVEYRLSEPVRTGSDGINHDFWALTVSRISDELSDLFMVGCVSNNSNCAGTNAIFVDSDSTLSDIDIQSDGTISLFYEKSVDNEPVFMTKEFTIVNGVLKEVLSL